MAFDSFLLLDGNRAAVAKAMRVHEDYRCVWVYARGWVTACVCACVNILAPAHNAHARGLSASERARVCGCEAVFLRAPTCPHRGFAPAAMLLQTHQWTMRTPRDRLTVHTSVRVRLRSTPSKFFVREWEFLLLVPRCFSVRALANKFMPGTEAIALLCARSFCRVGVPSLAILAQTSHMHVLHRGMGLSKMLEEYLGNYLRENFPTVINLRVAIAGYNKTSLTLHERQVCPDWALFSCFVRVCRARGVGQEGESAQHVRRGKWNRRRRV